MSGYWHSPVLNRGTAEEYWCTKALWNVAIYFFKTSFHLWSQRFGGGGL